MMTKTQYENLKRKLEAGELEDRDVARAKQMISGYETRQPNSGVTTIYPEGSFIDNFGKSGAAFVHDMTQLPFTAMRGLSDFKNDTSRLLEANAGALLTGKPLPGNEVTDGGDPYMWDGAASGIGDYISGRYGSVDAAKDTLYNDPFGAFGDIGAVGMGPVGAGKLLNKVAGTGTSLAARTGRQGAETLQKTGAFMESLDPYALALNAIGRPLHTAVNPVAERGEEFGNTIYPSLPADIKGDLDKSAAFTGNLADQGYDATTAGVRRAKFDKQVAANELNDLIAQAEAAGRDIPIYNLTTSLRLKRQEIIDANGPPDAVSSAVKQIDAAIEQLENLDTDVLTISSARQMRQQWEKNIPFQTEPSVADVPVAEGRREVSNALRNEINEITPAIAGANRRYSDAENARRAAESTKLANQRSSSSDLQGGGVRLGTVGVPFLFTGKTPNGRAAYNTRSYLDAVFQETASPIGRVRRVGQQSIGETENYIPDGRQVKDPRDEDEDEGFSFFDTIFRNYGR
jgi:hypothetical protein